MTPDPPAVEEPAQEEWEGPLELAEADALPTMAPAELRDVDPPEREALAECLQVFGEDVLARLEERWTFKVLARSDVMPHRRVVALDRVRLADLAPFPIVFIGIPVAYLARKGGRLTLEGGKLAAEYASRRVATVDEKGAQLFLYGRHLFSRSVRKVAGNVPRGAEVLVVDRLGRYLGIGIAEVPLGPKARRGDKDAVVVKNRLDLGLYLRGQQAVPQ